MLIFVITRELIINEMAFISVKYLSLGLWSWVLVQGEYKYLENVLSVAPVSPGSIYRQRPEEILLSLLFFGT